MPKGIYPRTEYHKRINSEGHKGLTPWNKGKKCPWAKPPHFTGEEHYLFGKHRTEETKLKISLSKRGKSVKSHSPTLEVREKIRNTLRKGKYIKCVLCGKERFVSPSEFKKGARFCSRECGAIAFSGENNPLWNGGTSRAYKTGYYSQKYKNWRKSVFERDNYTCKKCSFRGGYLTVHHIKSFSKFPELRFELLNGLTLCEDCHKKTDNYSGRSKKRKQDEYAMAV